MDQDRTDDLKAFERRMIEIVASLRPSIWRWRLILSILVILTLFTFYALVANVKVPFLSLLLTIDESTITKETQNESSVMFRILSCLLRKEIWFTLSFCLLIFAFLFGIHRKMVASSIIRARFRYVLTDYNMSCDDDGRLIIRPRPPMYYNG